MDNNPLFDEICEKEEKIARILAYKEYVRNKEMEEARGYKLDTTKEKDTENKPVKYCDIVKIGKSR